MARPKGYDFQKFYEQTIWNLIPPSKPGITWTEAFREAHKQTHMSRSTFRDYFRKLPTILEDGRYRRDPQIASEDDTGGLQRLRGLTLPDYWKDELAYLHVGEDDWQHRIDVFLRVFLRRYILTLNTLIQMDKENQAHELYELRMNFVLEELLRRIAASTWKNRRKIKGGFPVQWIEDTHLSLGGPSVDGHPR